MSRCFTWFPISGLGEPNIYHNLGEFTRMWGFYLESSDFLEWWTDKGFDAHDEGEKPKWLDFCVVQSIFGGPTLPCDWIEVHGRTACLKDETIGNVVGSDFKFKVI